MGNISMFYAVESAGLSMVQTVLTFIYGDVRSMTVEHLVWRSENGRQTYPAAIVSVRAGLNLSSNDEQDDGHSTSDRFVRSPMILTDPRTAT
jgi:hypothetical protein